MTGGDLERWVRDYVARARMKLVIRDLAAREILAAAGYYRDAAGLRFRKALVDEIGRALEHVLETPSGFSFCDEEKLVRGRRRPGLYRGR